MGVAVTAQQQYLKYQQAGVPHGRTPAKPRQNVLANDQLNLKQQEGTQKYGDGI
jgi:hypothetical protein